MHFSECLGNILFGLLMNYSIFSTTVVHPRACMRVKMFKYVGNMQRFVIHSAAALCSRNECMTILRFVNRKHLFCDLDPFQLFSIFDTSFSHFVFFLFCKKQTTPLPFDDFFSWSNCLSCLRQRISDSDFFEFIFTSFSTSFKKPITFTSFFQLLVFSVCKSADY